jgi:hypothetical protein
MKTILYTLKRLRVQAFRFLFTETADTITIQDIGPRGGIY